MLILSLDEYSGFRLLGYWDNDEVVLVSSVLLLWSSLESQSFRTPLFELDGAMQLKIQAFIQRFIETPSHLINRQLVMDAVLDITSGLFSFSLLIASDELLLCPHSSQCIICISY